MVNRRIDIEIRSFSMLVVANARCIAALLGLAIIGSAQAQSLEVPLKWTYKGAVYLTSYPYQFKCATVYTVPTGQTLRLTDFTLNNYSSVTSPLRSQYLCIGGTSCASYLTSFFNVPPAGTLINNMVTGYRVDAGQTLFACNYDDNAGYAAWSMNGYLYTNP